MPVYDTLLAQGSILVSSYHWQSSTCAKHEINASGEKKREKINVTMTGIPYTSSNSSRFFKAINPSPCHSLLEETFPNLRLVLSMSSVADVRLEELL